MTGAVQKAVYAKLSQSLSVPVYDSVPHGAQLPYVVLGEDFITDFSTKDIFGENCLLSLHVFSGYRGMREVKEIVDMVVDALRNGVHSDTFVVAFSGLDNIRFFKEEDGVQHGVVQIRMKILRRGE